MTQRLRTQAARAAQRPLSLTRTPLAESASLATLRPVHFTPARCDSIRAWRAGLRGSSQGSVQRSASSRSGGRGAGSVVAGSAASRRRGMQKWRENLKKPREEVQPVQVVQEAQPAPRVYQAPPQQQQAQPQAPSFVGNMITYLMLGAGMTAGLIFVRLATGLEAAPSDAQIERWPSSSRHRREQEQAQAQAP